MSPRPTARELDTMIAVIESGTERRAAERLGVTEHAVHKRIAALRTRFGVRTTAQAFAISVRDGWVAASSLSVGTRSDR